MGLSTRTCIGCRRQARATELVRLVTEDGRLRPGPRAGHPGRGASIHPRESCVVAAVERRAFARAFRLPLSPLPGFESNGKSVDALALKTFANEVELAYISQQPRSR
jgi:predicted RNA-binding protein YlxR (DUF448 family)